MIGEELAKKVIESILERMREIESVKAPNMVHGFDLLKIAAIGERACLLYTSVRARDSFLPTRWML